jgi:hypothetical protein
MADLSELNSGLPVKLTGASSSGAETNFVNATANGDLKAADILNAAVTQGSFSLGLNTPVEVKAGASRLVNRKSVQIQAQGTNIQYGYSAGSQPFTIPNGTTVVLALGDGVGVWVVRTGGLLNVTLAYAEFA